MPVYSAITDGEIDPDSPITQDLATRIRDNPLAIADGDSTAPKSRVRGLDATQDMQGGGTPPAGTVPMKQSDGSVKWTLKIPLFGVISSSGSNSCVSRISAPPDGSYAVSGVICIHNDVDGEDVGVNFDGRILISGGSISRSELFFDGFYTKSGTAYFTARDFTITGGGSVTFLARVWNFNLYLSGGYLGAYIERAAGFSASPSYSTLSFYSPS